MIQVNYIGLLRAASTNKIALEIYLIIRVT